MRYDAVVVGGGISGLLSALALSKEGKKVVVLEKDSFVGGNLRTYDVDGFLVDTGPHAITALTSGPLVELMEKYFTILPKFVPYGLYYVRDGDKFLPFPSTLQQFARFNILSKRDRLLATRALIDGVAKSSVSKGSLEKSVYDYLKGYSFSDKCLRFIDALSYFLSGKSMHETPAWRMLTGGGQVDDNETGIGSHVSKFTKLVKHDVAVTQGYPLGGVGSITTCVLNSLPKKGVEIRTGECVEEIMTKDGRVCEVATSESSYVTDTVVYTGFANELPEVVDEKLPKEYLRILRNLQQTTSMTVWLGLKKKICALDYMGSEIMFDSETPYWAMPTSNYCKTLAPKGKQLMGFCSPLKGKPKSYEKKLLGAIYSSIPGIEQHVEMEHMQISMPDKASITVNAEFPTPKSPIGGLYLAGTDTDKRSMGVTRAAYSVVEMLKYMQQDGML